MYGSSSTRRRRRLWRFAGAEFDEASWALRVGGSAVTLESKPLEVLHELLLRSGEVVTKEEILDAVWPGVTVVEGSLTTAISKLRKALGEQQDAIIETVPRIGYRLTCPVSIEGIDSPLAPRFTFVPGDPVPGRNQWALDRVLGDTGSQDVWLARHMKTGAQRVFKFADAPDRLRALKREAALARILFAGLGAAAPLPALMEWNFDASPYFLEYAYGGRDLIEWAGEGEGLGAIPLSRRLDVAALICRAVADVHGLGVLHKDLKPANILISDGVDGPEVKLADFGSGRLLDDAVLHSFRITDPGSLNTDLGKDEPRSGTLAYRAPELVGDALPTVKSDVYALGLILYQLVVADFSATLAPGWEGRVDDPLLREDIRLAAEGTPERRLPSAAELAARIEQLAQRREQAMQEAEHASFLADQREQADRRRARRPWVYAVAASLVIGCVVSSALAIYAWSQRDRAIAARDLADTGYSFIAEDILASPDPARSSADETVIHAIKRASRNIDQRFAGYPAVAARLHLSVARAFHQRGDVDTARAEYQLADRLFEQAGEAAGDDAVIARLGRAHMESTSGQPARLEEAGRMIARERASLGTRAERGRTGFALAQAEGAQGYMTDIASAERAFRRAVEIGEAPGAGVAATQLLKVKSSLVLTMMRQGRAKEAEPVARAIIDESRKVRGADHPDTLVTRQHWLTSLSMMGRHQDAIRESASLVEEMEKRFGATHRFTLGLRSTRFESHAALGQYQEAAREAEQVWRGASSQAGPASHQALVGQIDHASALCRTPQRQRAATIVEDGLSQVLKAFGPDYPLTHVVRYFAAECLLINQRHADAGRLLQVVDRRKLVELTGQQGYAAGVDLGLAEVALFRGDKGSARTLLTAARANPETNRDAFTSERIERLTRLLGN